MATNQPVKNNKHTFMHCECGARVHVANGGERNLEIHRSSKEHRQAMADKQTHKLSVFFSKRPTFAPVRPTAQLTLFLFPLPSRLAPPLRLPLDPVKRLIRSAPALRASATRLFPRPPLVLIHLSQPPAITRRLHHAVTLLRTCI
ncbi:hypothetical protein AURDEDRAFT_167825 [Auricularia subglabra TFB-10046 SS5]|nr:hypothetical protein AURDEDRAFT_167825 [Auricularia subglabra TFB-10046 SS5]